MSLASRPMVSGLPFLALVSILGGCPAPPSGFSEDGLAGHGEARAEATGGAKAGAAGDGEAGPPLHEDVLRRGEGLDSPLGRLGLKPDERQGVVQALAGIAEVRRLPVGTGVGVVRDDDAAPVLVSLRVAPDAKVLVERDPEGYRARREALPAESTLEKLRATVTSNVYEAIVDRGGTPELVLAFSDVFQWDLDCFADPRVGDQVALLYQVPRAGTVPPHTPRWREEPDVAGQPMGTGRILAASYLGERVSVRGVFFEDPETGPGYFDETGRSLRKTFLKSPLNYRRISSGFSRARRHPITRKVVPHHGVDYAAPAGTPVVAAADGRVVAAGWKGALGRHVWIRHGSGRFETVYGHLSGLARGIRSGATVEQNQVVGYVGATGRATGPHLHYEIRKDGHPINPLTLDNPPVGPVSAEARESFDRTRDHLLARLEERPTASAPASGGTAGR